MEGELNYKVNIWGFLVLLAGGKQVLFHNPFSFLLAKLHTTWSYYQYWCPLNPEDEPQPHSRPQCLPCRSPQPRLPDPWLSCCSGLTHFTDSPSALISCPPCLFLPKLWAVICFSIFIKLTVVSPASWPHFLISHSLDSMKKLSHVL